MQIHFDAVDEIVERLARQRKLRHEGFEARALRRQRRIRPEQPAHFGPPHQHFRRRGPGILRLIHGIVHGAAEIPHHADRLALRRWKHEKGIGERCISSHVGAYEGAYGA